MKASAFAMTWQQKHECINEAGRLAAFLRKHGHADNAERVEALAVAHVQRVPTKVQQ